MGKGGRKGTGLFLFINKSFSIIGTVERISLKTSGFVALTRDGALIMCNSAWLIFQCPNMPSLNV